MNIDSVELHNIQPPPSSCSTSTGVATAAVLRSSASTGALNTDIVNDIDDTTDGDMSGHPRHDDTNSEAALLLPERDSINQAPDSLSMLAGEPGVAGASSSSSAAAAAAGRPGGGHADASASTPCICSIAWFRQLSRHAVGIILILLVAVIWVGSSEFLQFVFGNQKFDKPFFVTYFNTMTFGLWMFGFVCPGASGFGRNPWTHAAAASQSGNRRGGMAGGVTAVAAVPAVAGGDATPRNQMILPSTPSAAGGGAAARASASLAPVTPPTMRSEMRSTLSLDEAVSSGARAPTATASDLYSGTTTQTTAPQGAQSVAAAEADDNEEEEVTPYSVAQVAYAAFLFCPLWFLANVLFNYSLSRTSVASNTILSSTSTVWAMFFSRVLLGEHVTPRKVLALALSFGGAAMVGFGDTGGSGGSSKSSLEGNILAGVSAMFYAAYTTVLRHNLPDERRYPIGMCFAFVGVFNALLLWPGMLALSYLGVEPFQWPSATVAGFLLLNGLVGTNLSDMLWAKSVILTSPVIATLGLSLTIPTAVIADLALRGQWHPPLYLGGAACVTLGFIVANVRRAPDEE